MRRSIFSIILFSLILASPAIVSAQSIGGMLDNIGSFTILVNPQYPVPGGQATLSFLSSTLDLANATLAVSSGGKQIYQGNIQPVAVSLGKTGSATTVSVKITSDGASYSKSVVIQPEDVSLIAEPLSSAPALYPGKPLVPLGGNTRVVAIANFKDAAGKTLNPSTLSYSWVVDGAQIANSSGIGKTTIVVASPLQYRERDVSVSVRSASGNLVGGAELSLHPSEASLRIYENDPLLGVRFERALSSTYSIQGTESSLYAAPFSLPLSNGTPTLQWFLNGSMAQAGPLITLRPTGSGKGNASLSLVAMFEDITKATTNLSLSFGAKPNSNFFGL